MQKIRLNVIRKFFTLDAITSRKEKGRMAFFILRGLGVLLFTAAILVGTFHLGAVIPHAFWSVLFVVSFLGLIVGLMFFLVSIENANEYHFEHLYHKSEVHVPDTKVKEAAERALGLGYKLLKDYRDDDMKNDTHQESYWYVGPVMVFGKEDGTVVSFSAKGQAHVYIRTGRFSQYTVSYRDLSKYMEADGKVPSFLTISANIWQIKVYRKDGTLIGLADLSQHSLSDAISQNIGLVESIKWPEKVAEYLKACSENHPVRIGRRLIGK